MSKNTLAVKWVEEQLRDNMYEGNMHIALRDAGRLAGGYASAGHLTHSEIAYLQSVAEGLAISPKVASKTWLESVEYGRSEPVVIEDLDTSGQAGAMSWDSTIGGKAAKDELKVVDQNWLSDEEIPACPPNWDGKKDLIKYLQALFEQDEYVGYCTETYYSDAHEKYIPNKGVAHKTQGKIIKEINKFDCLTYGVGDYKEEVGGWCRVNPMDGSGSKDSNVTEFRHALIESDEQSMSKQYAILKELQLPITTLVHSGGKSLHATVRIDADNLDEYRKRVDFLYEVCAKNGLKIDRANRNPSRLSRMAGLTRNGKPQYLLGTHLGQPSWNDWKDWIEDQNDELPEMESLEEILKKDQKLAPELIKGVLREGHKMMIAGPSKAGKSFSLIQLTVAIAEGREWNGWGCEKGKVLYVNLELDAPSCTDRFAKIYKALGIDNPCYENVDIWNLRGKSAPMDKLAPKLIRRALKKRYKAIIIDPIYKVLTGDENSAEQMAHFCNQFDRVATELKAAVIFCHHHSKGSQGGKNSADRSSGSGVFARDPDAILDLIELEIDKDKRKVLEDKVTIQSVLKYCRFKGVDYSDELSLDDQETPNRVLEFAQRNLAGSELSSLIFDARSRAESMTAWRVEGTLREFPTFKPYKCWFSYPIHRSDELGLLEDARASGEVVKLSQSEKAEKAKERKEKREQEAIDKKEKFYKAVQICGSFGDRVSLEDIAEQCACTVKTVRNNLKNDSRVVIVDSYIFEDEEQAESYRQEKKSKAGDDLYELVKGGFDSVAKLAEKINCTEKTVRNKIKKDDRLVVEKSEVKIK